MRKFDFSYDKENDDINSGITKIALENLQKCLAEIKPYRNQLLIKLFLFVNEKEIPATFTVPNITEESPALAYA